MVLILLFSLGGPSPIRFYSIDNHSAGSLARCDQVRHLHGDIRIVRGPFLVTPTSRAASPSSASTGSNACFIRNPPWSEPVAIVFSGGELVSIRSGASSTVRTPHSRARSRRWSQMLPLAIRNSPDAGTSRSAKTCRMGSRKLQCPFRAISPALAGQIFSELPRSTLVNVAAPCDAAVILQHDSRAVGDASHGPTLTVTEAVSHVLRLTFGRAVPHIALGIPETDITAVSETLGAAMIGTFKLEEAALSRGRRSAAANPHA